jgi:antitoxin HicB
MTFGDPVNSLQYTVILTPGSDQGGYSVRVPALQGCNTQGDTLEEALGNAREAIELYLDALREQGETPPADTDEQLVRIKVRTTAA